MLPSWLRSSTLTRHQSTYVHIFLTLGPTCTSLFLFNDRLVFMYDGKVVATSILVLIMYDGKVIDTSIAVLNMYLQYDVTNMYLRYCKYDVLFVSIQKDSSSTRYMIRICYVTKAML